jgi:hypothetical protein
VPAGDFAGAVQPSVDRHSRCCERRHPIFPCRLLQKEEVGVFGISQIAPSGRAPGLRELPRVYAASDERRLGMRVRLALYTMTTLLGAALHNSSPAQAQPGCWFYPPGECDLVFSPTWPTTCPPPYNMNRGRVYCANSYQRYQLRCCVAQRPADTVGGGFRRCKGGFCAQISNHVGDRMITIRLLSFPRSTHRNLRAANGQQVQADETTFFGSRVSVQACNRRAFGTSACTPWVTFP